MESMFALGQRRSVKGVGDARWRPAVKAMESGGVTAGGFPSLAVRPLDRIRDFGGELGSAEPRVQSHRPHLYLLRSVTGAL